jgi:hypothetical protein
LYHLHYQHTFIHVECNAAGNVPSPTAGDITNIFSQLHKPVAADVATNQSTCTFILMFTDPMHCPAAHCSAMTHHFSLNLLYLETLNYGPYQGKDQTWVSINNIYCTNILQSNLKTSTDVIRNLHNTPLINSLTSIFPTINFVPDIFISPCTHIYIYIYMYIHMYMYVWMYVCMYDVCKQAYVLCETKDKVTVENSELKGHVVKTLKNPHQVSKFKMF